MLWSARARKPQSGDIQNSESAMKPDVYYIYLARYVICMENRDYTNLVRLV